jgi:twitching motility protein PilJ
MLKNFSLLQNLKVWQRLVLIALLMGLPIPVITYLLVSERNNSIDIARKEELGVNYMGPLESLMKDLGRHRTMMHGFLRGDLLLKNQAMEIERRIDQHFASAEEMDQKQARGFGQSHGTLFQTTGRLLTLNQKWGALKGHKLNSRPAESFDEHTQLINETLDLIKFVADRSTLILDPQLDTYYLMDVSTLQITQLTETLEQMRGAGAAAAVAGAVTPDESTKMGDYIRQVQMGLKNLQRGVDVAREYNPGLREQSDGGLNAAIKEIETYLALTDRAFVRSRTPGIPAGEYIAGLNRAMEQLTKVDDALEQSLIALLREREQRIKRDRLILLGVIALGVLAAVLAVLAIAKSVTRQTEEILRLIGRVEQGDTEARARVVSEDELGRAAGAFNSMLDNMKGLIQSRDDRDQIQREIMRLLNEVDDVAKGDLTGELEITEGMIGAIADAFNYMIGELRRLIYRVQDVSLQVTSSVGEAQQVTASLARGSQEQALQINQTSAALGEMASSIQRVSEDASTLASVAEQSVDSARKGTTAVEDTVKGMSRIQEQVQETARRMKQLGERSEEIEEIVELIEEIADRTGVLALNASIQASAAGEAGQGFAVVANEVEQLSRRSTEATKKISNLVKAIQNGTLEAISAMEETSREVSTGSKLANQAGQTLDDIGTVSKRLSELIQAISLAARRQAHGSASLAQTMSQIAQITQQATDDVSHSEQTVRGIAHLVNELRASVVSFKLPQSPGNRNGYGNGNGRH